jgi:hypothetical protein
MEETGCLHPPGTTTTMKVAVRVATTLVTVYYVTQRAYVTAESRIRSQGSLCSIYDGRSDTELHCQTTNVPP